MRRKSTARSKKKIVAIDFFCGAGGVTHGFSKAGLEVIAGFDHDDKTRYAYEKNNPHSTFYNLDIKEIDKHVKVI